MSLMDTDEATAAPGDKLASKKSLLYLMGRDDLIQFLDSIDIRVEDLRKEAFKLQDKGDHLSTRIDMLKNTDLLINLSGADQEEISCILKRINERLQTVEISVMTVRDTSQVDSLSIINHLIDEVIRFEDPITKRQKCQEYFSTCSSDYAMSFTSSPVVFIDKQFEGHLLGCNLDDQKRIKKRVEALLNYMVQQIISE